ncbi:hypothetical protein AB4454_05190 [Vibrio artabrorum]|uniref:hypothetical protein n=1 Tax=Vibrio artabrorum TaxID=446374 RepID=UPI003551EA51
MKKALILGGSNSLKKNGISLGLSKHLDIQNLALGASTSLQNLYEIIRNKDAVLSSDLIITESNVNDFHNFNELGYDYNVLENNIKLFYQQLSMFNKKILVLILPLQTKRFHNSEKINEIHRGCISRYGFNLIDMDRFYIQSNISEFYYFENLDHPLDCIMRKLGEVIGENLSLLEVNETNKFNSQNGFQVISNLSNKKIKKENSRFREVTNIIEENVSININNIIPLGVHSWSNTRSNYKMVNGDIEMVKATNSECQFHEVQQVFGDVSSWKLTGTCEVETEKSIRCSNKAIDGRANIISVFTCENRNILEFCSVKPENDMTYLLKFISEYKTFFEHYTSSKRFMSKWLRIIYKYRKFLPYEQARFLYSCLKK